AGVCGLRALHPFPTRRSSDLRQLAYPVHKVHKAHYVLMNIECELPALREIESAFRFSDAVLRSLVIHRDEAVTEPSPLMKEKERSEEHTSELQSQPNLVCRLP